MTRLIQFLVLIALVSAVLPSRGCADPVVEDRDLPRRPPTEADKTLATFKIKPGFQIELAAAEPLVVSPVAMAFDENGRLFVVEMRDYSERRNETPRLGRVRLLEDSNSDGRFDRSTVYVDNLPWPTAVTCYAGGIFLGATPDLLYCKDTNGDGVADVREVVFTGFASDQAPFETNRLNVQAMLNSFNWGIDNRIHGATSLSGGRVGLVNSEFTREWIRRATGAAASPSHDSRIELRGRDFSFDPRTLELRAESGGGQHGLSFDSRGRKFVCSNSDHIQMMMYEDRHAMRSLDYDLPPSRVSIAADGPAAEVFRVSPEEPWRVVRTKWRVAGLVPGLIEGGGRASGYFTGATGTTIYRGDAFPEEYRENAFVADCGSNLVHRKRLYPDQDGVGLVARRADDERNVEFLASTDNWFRPVQFVNAPDGCLYLADMYREVIEHPWSIPESIKRHLDLNSGSDRGRIYRIAPVGFRQPSPPRLSTAATTELVALLASANGWSGDTAARLLYERQDRQAVAPLEQVLKESPAPLGKVRALYTLNGVGALTEAHLLAGLADASEVVRQHAVRLLEELSPPVRQRVKPEFPRLAADPSALVRYQLCWTLGTGFRGEEKAAAMTAIALRDSHHAWFRAALLGSLHHEAGEVFFRLAANSEFRESTNGQAFLCEIARVIARQRDTNALARVLDQAVAATGLEFSFGLVDALEEGASRSGGSPGGAAYQSQLDSLKAKARTIAVDRSAPEGDRLASVRLLSRSAGEESRQVLMSLLAADQPEAVRSAALGGLGRSGDAGIAADLLSRWSDLTPALRGRALSLLLSRSQGVQRVLEAIERGAVARTELSTPQLQSLRAHPDAMVRRRTVEVFGPPPTAGRQEVVSALVSALSLPGDAGRGRVIYRERCASCHRLGGEGKALGPDLASVKTSGRESLLVSILDPNRQVAPGYLNFTIETKEGQTLSGAIVHESASSVSLRGPDGAENVVSRSIIELMRTEGKSVMPDGLEAGLTAQDLADLLACIVVAE